MAATGMIIKYILFSCFISSIFTLYADQAGKFDWRQQYIGRATKLFWEQTSSVSVGKRVYVATDRNVLASLSAGDGSISWRKVLENDDRGRIDDVIYNGDVLVTALGGRRVVAWAPMSGMILWDTLLIGSEGHRSLIKFAGESPKGMVVCLTSFGLYGIQLRDGEQKWEVELPDSDNVDYNKLLVYDGTVYIVGMTMGSEVKVIAVDLEGSVTSKKSVIATFKKGTRCVESQGHYLVCYCSQSDSFQVLNLQSPHGFVPTSLQDLDVGVESIQTDSWSSVMSTNENGVLVKLNPNHSVYIKVIDGGRVGVIRDLPKVMTSTIVKYDDKDYLLTVEQSGYEFAIPNTTRQRYHDWSKELSLRGFDVSSNEEISELNQKFIYPNYNGQPMEALGLLARRSKDGKMAYKLIILSEDYSLQLVHRNGKVLWRREECLAYTAAVEMVDLPVSENQAKFEDEFGSQADNIMTMFVKRIKTQLSQLHTFLLHQVHRLQTGKHHTSLMSSEDEEDEDLLRDEFNLHKMIILVTSPGKIIAMLSMNGQIVWQHFIPELAPFNRFDKEKFLLYTQRTTAHFPHEPQCMVVGRNRLTGRGHIYAFNPITGQQVDQMPASGIHLPYNILQVFLLGEMDEHFLRAAIMMDETYQIHVYPKNLQHLVKEKSHSLFMFTVDTEKGVLNGYRILAKDGNLLGDRVWNINIQNTRQNLKITNIVAKAANEHVHSQGRVLGDRSVLYKYLNPNAVVITAEGEEPATSQQKAYPFLNIYIVDMVTGHMIFHCNHRKAEGPVHVVHSENWAVVNSCECKTKCSTSRCKCYRSGQVCMFECTCEATDCANPVGLEDTVPDFDQDDMYTYYSTKSRRHEMAVVEMFEGKQQSNATAFSSFSAPTQPLVMRQSFVFPMPLFTIATTVTEKGITNKDILVALKTGGIFSLPKAFLDPRRPLQPTQETAEEGTLPYIPELPVHTEGIMNYNQTLYNVRGIHTAPTGLESTSLVLSYGLDLFHTRVRPSKMFDVLKEDFEHWLIAGVLLSMMAASFITQKLAARRALNKQWK